MLNIKLYQAGDTIKETYTDEELRVLLQKPNMRKCNFSEYRNWVVINLLVNKWCDIKSRRRKLCGGVITLLFVEIARGYMPVP